MIQTPRDSHLLHKEDVRLIKMCEFGTLKAHLIVTLSIDGNIEKIKLNGTEAELKVWSNKFIKGST